jgi:recombination protein RecA
MAVAQEEPGDEINDILGFDIKSIKKEWKGKFKAGHDFKDDELQHISTGSIKLDWALKRPFLEGQLVEIFAPNATGKTTLALHVAKNAMKMNKQVFYLDLERKLRESQIEMIPGFDRKNFTLVYPDTGEEAMNMMHELITDHPGCVVVLDSVGGILPEVEDAEDFEKQSRALVARLCHKMIRKITGITARNKCVVIFLNHLTATMAAYGKPFTTHGGKAIENRAAQRIELFAPAAGAIKVGSDKVGQMVRATVVKNNVNRPFITVEFPLIYGRGIDENLDMLQFAKDLGILPYKNGWYLIPQDDGEPKRMRQADVLEMIEMDPGFKKSIEDKVMTLFG